MIVLHLLGALGVVYFCGFGIASVRGGSAWIPVMGYAASQSLFFFSISILRRQYGGGGSAGRRCRADRLGLWPPRRAANHSDRVTGGRNFALCSSWNSCIDDGGMALFSCRGRVLAHRKRRRFRRDQRRDAYIFKEVPLQEYWELMRTSAIGFDATKDVAIQDPAKRLVAVYADDFGRLQYSSTAFWSVMLDVREGMDAWLIQALLNLLLMTHGLILLIRRALPMGAQAAAVVATVAVTNHFYLTTYLNGHQGSLMFAAVAPYGLLLTLDLMGNSIGVSYEMIGINNSSAVRFRRLSISVAFLPARCICLLVASALFREIVAATLRSRVWIDLACTFLRGCVVFIRTDS